MPNCRTNLLGIKLIYCVDGRKEEVWVDLDKVHALAWCDEEVGAKGKGAGGNSKLPTTKKTPGECPEVGVRGDEAVCWWNGSEWVCGDEN